MLGVAYLRKQLGYSGEEFGVLFGVTRTAVSKWESGKQPIPVSKLDKISSEFDIPSHLLVLELDDDGKRQIYEAAYRYIAKKDGILVDQELIDEVQYARYSERVSKVSAACEQDPNVLEMMESVLKIINFPQGRSAVNLLLKSGESYYDIASDLLVLGESNYASNRIRKDDGHMILIADVLKLALKPGK